MPSLIPKRKLLCLKGLAFLIKRLVDKITETRQVVLLFKVLRLRDVRFIALSYGFADSLENRKEKSFVPVTRDLYKNQRHAGICFLTICGQQLSHQRNMPEPEKEHVHSKQ